jgi:hypothetical protein
MIRSVAWREKFGNVVWDDDPIIKEGPPDVGGTRPAI